MIFIFMFQQLSVSTFIKIPDECLKLRKVSDRHFSKILAKLMLQFDPIQTIEIKINSKRKLDIVYKALLQKISMDRLTVKANNFDSIIR